MQNVLLTKYLFLVGFSFSSNPAKLPFSEAYNIGISSDRVAITMDKNE